jgi:hypothetical protein
MLGLKIAIPLCNKHCIKKCENQTVNENKGVINRFTSRYKQKLLHYGSNIKHQNITVSRKQLNK